MEHKTREQITQEEITKNPIFLLQRRRMYPFHDAPIDIDRDIEGYVDPLNQKHLSDDDLLELGYGFVAWEVVTVLLTREEAEDFGEKTKHHYGKGRKGVDWMVYCMPCEGELAEMLKFFDLTDKAREQIEIAKKHLIKGGMENPSMSDVIQYMVLYHPDYF
jgi:hypothetical protein